MQQRTTPPRVLSNDTEIRDFTKLHFRTLCDQFGELTLKGRKTPENGWRVTCEEIPVYVNGSGVGSDSHTDYPPRLKFKVMNKKRGLSIVVNIGYSAPYFSSFNATNSATGHGLRVEWVIKQKTIGSGYEALAKGVCGPGYDPATHNLDGLKEVAEAAKMSDEADQSKPILDAVPNKFNEKEFVVKPNHSGTMLRVSNSGQIGSVGVVGIVSLKGRTIELEEPCEPEKKPFFLCEGWGQQGATFNLITDGETFYPCTRITNSTNKKRVRLQKNFGKASLDADQFNRVDQRMVQTAIEAYIGRTFSG